MGIAQTSYIISKPDVSLNNNILTIKYDISGCGKNEFVDITLYLVTSHGDTLKPKYITGDLGNTISCGPGKTIQWNLEKDKILINDDIEAFIKGEKSALPMANMYFPKSQKLTRGKVIFSSAFIPGLGQLKASGKPVHLLFSGLVYGSLGTAIYLTYRSGDLKVKYNEATGTLRDDMYDKWQDNYKLSKTLFIVAGGAWITNILWSAIIPIKDRPLKNLKVSLDTQSGNRFIVSAKWKF